MTKFRETATSGKKPRKQPKALLPKRWIKQSRECWKMECPAPGLNRGTHPSPNCLFVISSRWDREGLVKSTDMLALGGPPFKNSSFFAATDTSSCRFPSSLATLADEFRNYTGLPNCCYWVEQALLRPSSCPHHCTGCYRRREEGRKNAKACSPPFWSSGSSCRDGIHAEKSLKDNYKGICLQMQNSISQNDELWCKVKLDGSYSCLGSQYRTSLVEGQGRPCSDSYLHTTVPSKNKENENG